MRTPEEIAAGLVTVQSSLPAEWVEKREQGWRSWLASVVAARDAEWVRLALTDSPVSERGLAEARAECLERKAENRRWIHVPHMEALLALIDHLTAQIAHMRRDNGYEDGYRAGRASVVPLVQEVAKTHRPEHGFLNSILDALGGAK